MTNSEKRKADNQFHGAREIGTEKRRCSLYELIDWENVKNPRDASEHDENSDFEQSPDFKLRAQELTFQVVCEEEEEEHFKDFSKVEIVMHPDERNYATEAHAIIDYATTLINYYNTKNNTNYELVKPFGKMGRLHYRRCKFGDLSHCAFQASSGDSSIKTFFAELMVESGKMIVYFCRILDVDKIGCEICDAKIADCFSLSHVLQTPRGSRWQKTVQEEDDSGFAEMALDYYNKIHDTDYVFMRYEESCACIFPVVLVHFNFIAKPRVDADGALSKLFFAEVDSKTNFCCILYELGWHVDPGFLVALPSMPTSPSPIPEILPSLSITSFGNQKSLKRSKLSLGRLFSTRLTLSITFKRGDQIRPCPLMFVFYVLGAGNQSLIFLCIVKFLDIFGAVFSESGGIMGRH